MKQLNNLFVILFVLIGLLSIAYIWKSEADKKALEIESDNQSQEISFLKNKILELEKEDGEQGDVMGIAKLNIGKVSGMVKFSNQDYSDNTIVCAQNELTTKEFCTDELLKTEGLNELQYNLEIPKGKYSIYAIAPPDSNKTYYSKLQKCTDDSCKNDQKMLLEVIEDETQTNVDLYF